MKASIIAYGEDIYGDEILEEIESSDYIICADGAGNIAYKMGIIPQYLIGDFDSIDRELLDFFKSKGVNTIRYPREKDYTDTEICVYKALELGCRDICIIAGLGSRIDHSLGNIGLLHLIEQRGARGYIHTSNCSIYLCSAKIQLAGNIGDTISIIPFYGCARGIRSTGLKYELNNMNIDFGKTIGISNEMTDVKCSIEIEDGEILVIKQKVI